MIAALAVGLLGGCGNTDEESQGNKPPGAAGDPGQSGGALQDSGGGGGGAKTITVNMENIEYVPRDVSVPVGGKVVWTNTDGTAHTVTKEEGPGKPFDSGNMDQGAKFEQTFTERGKINYVCNIHPNQTGTITVR